MESWRLALAFDGVEVGERGAGEAAGFFQEMRVFVGEFAAALIEDFHDAFGALRAGQRSEERGFHARAAGIIEVLEAVVGDFLAAEAARFGGFVDFGEQSFADGFAQRREPLAGFVPAHAADQAFGASPLVRWEPSEAACVHTKTARAPRVAPTRAANVFSKVSWSRQAKDTLASSKSAEDVSMTLPGEGAQIQPLAAGDTDAPTSGRREWAQPNKSGERASRKRRERRAADPGRQRPEAANR